MSHNQNNDGRELKQERQESKSERLEKKAENRERSEAVSELSSGSLNEQKRLEQNQEKANRSQSLAEQIQKKGVAKIGPITNHFRQSIEITKTDEKTGKVETLVKGRTQEEVDHARQLKKLQEASEQGLLIGAGGNFTVATPSIDEQQVIEANTAKMEPNSRGWRMMPFDLRAPNGQLIEFQVLTKEMYEAGKETHSIHERWRGKRASDLTKEQYAQMLDDRLSAYKCTESAWNKYLKRTGQTASDIEKYLNQVTDALR